MTDPVITADELTSYDKSVRIADVRWYLDEPGRAHHAYHAGHLPEAIYVDLDLHLSGSTGPGRHPLPDRDEFSSALEGLGFGDDHLIVVYDDGDGASAARLWWMLRDIGHHEVRVLDGGITAWQAAERALEKKPPHRLAVTLSVHPSTTRRIDRAELADRLEDVTLLDARAPERYRGDEEPIDPVAGHIPTAISAHMAGNLADDGTFLDGGTLRDRFSSLGVTADRDTVLYCGSGVSACHNALAIARAGLPEPILYPGSWSDWSTSGGAVATGSEPGSMPNTQ